MRTALSRLLLVGFLGVAVFAVISLTSGASRALVALEGVGPDDLDHEAFTAPEGGTFAVEAVGSFEEAGSAASDTTLAAYGWLVRREDEAVVWQMRPAKRPERGTLVSLTDTVRLEPGTYDAYFTAFGDPLVRAAGSRDASIGERLRAFLSRGGRSWVGDAGRWRLLVSAVDAPARTATDDAAVSDPARGLEADSLTVWQGLGVEDRDRREALLEVAAPARVVLRTTTEVTDGVVADRAWIARLGSGDTVWTAAGEGAWAGGSLKNRAFTDTLSLEPGLYRAAFETDRSHAYEDWTANPPLVPWRWGLEVRRATAGDAVALLDPTDLDLPRIAGFDCVGPDRRVEAVVTVPARTDVLVVAVGEITSGSRYDYAELGRFDGTEWDEVWEMEGDGTEWAGGAQKNRRAVRALTLEPGRYRLLYEADGSHDCESGYNGDGGPTSPFWGAALYALDPDADPDAFAVTLHTESDEAPEAEPVDLDLPDDDLLLASIDSVGNDEDRRERFFLDGERDVLVIAQGEFSDETGYDVASIRRPDGEVVWEMSWQNSRPGGHSLFHRRFRDVVRLGPGAYDLRFTSDGSRAFGDFGPSSRQLWGARVYRVE